MTLIVNRIRSQKLYTTSDIMQSLPTFYPDVFPINIVIMKITKEELTTLLKQAQKAHHEYDQRSMDPCERDDEWAVWYASYIEEKITKFRDADEDLEINYEL